MLSNIVKATAPTASVPVFRSSATAVDTANAQNITVDRPTGVIAGDLLIAVFTVRGSGDGDDINAYMSSMPTGFSLVAQVQNSSDRSLSAIATKVATASEPTTYTFVATSISLTDPDIGTLTMLAYSNATRVNTQGGFNRTTTSTATANSISPTFVGTLLFVAYGSRTNEDLISVTTPPANMVSRTSVAARNSIDGPSQRTVVYEQSPVYTGATGTRSIVWNTSQNTQSILLQITNEPEVAPEFVASATTQNATTGTNLVIDKPTGTIEGDLMVAVMASNGALTGGWTDTTFTEVADQGAVNPSLRVAYKVAGASEPSNYTFSSTDTDVKAGSIVTYRYASYNSVSAFVTGQNPLKLTGATAAASQSILLAIGARAAASITAFDTAPVGMTTVASNSDATAPSFGVASQSIPAGPAALVARLTGSTTAVAGLLVTLSPTRSL